MSLSYCYFICFIWSKKLFHFTYIDFLWMWNRLFSSCYLSLTFRLGCCNWLKKITCHSTNDSSFWSTACKSVRNEDFFSSWLFSSNKQIFLVRYSTFEIIFDGNTCCAKEKLVEIAVMISSNLQSSQMIYESFGCNT